jgi:hypothetical protein
MKVSLPQQLKTVSVGTISRDALGAYGTTPEKVNENFSVRKRDEKSNPMFPSSIDTPKERADRGKPRTNFESANDSFFETSSVATTPSMATTPFAKPVEKEGNNVAFGSTTASFPSLSMRPPKPSGGAIEGTVNSAAQTEKANNEKLSKETVEGKNTPVHSFGNLQTLSDSLFGSSNDSKVPISVKPQELPSATQASGSSTPDYVALLTSFYQQHNPQKVREVDHSLTKYKVGGIKVFRC